MNEDRKFYEKERLEIVRRYEGKDPYRIIGQLEKQLTIVRQSNRGLDLNLSKSRAEREAFR